MGRRFFRHGELPLVVIALLAERPMHAYELMGELGRLFAPDYRPSPGSVYPAVEALEAEGLIRRQGDAGPRIYRLNPSGEQALEARRHALAALELRAGVRIGQRDRVDAALQHFSARVLGLAGCLEPDALERVLDRTLDDIEKTAVTQQPADEEARR